MIPDPLVMPYGSYAKFGVNKTSYNCKAMVESYQLKLFKSKSLSEKQISRAILEKAGKCYENYDIPIELFGCQLQSNMFYLFHPYNYEMFPSLYTLSPTLA